MPPGHALLDLPTTIIYLFPGAASLLRVEGPRLLRDKRRTAIWRRVGSLLHGLRWWQRDDERITALGSVYLVAGGGHGVGGSVGASLLLDLHPPRRSNS